MEMLSSLSIAFLLVWGAINAGGKSTIEVQAMYGQIIAFTLWIYQLYRPIRQLADKFNVLQRGVVRAERIFEIIDHRDCLLYTSPSPRDRTRSRMPSSA